MECYSVSTKSKTLNNNEKPIGTAIPWLFLESESDRKKI